MKNYLIKKYIMIRIHRKEDCTGCWACVNICPMDCIEMETDSEGFWYPAVDYNRCDKCGLCIKACPILNKSEAQNESLAYACINKDRDIREESSSGGAFSAIGKYVIEQNGVVFGACFDGEYNVFHDCVDTVDDLKKIRGSKYVQSVIGGSFKKVKKYLQEDKLVLFSGTPCQVSGLTLYLQHKYDNLITQDIICHGVPSPKAWRKYLETFSSKEKIKAVSFRSKDYGWDKFSMKIDTDGGRYIKDLSRDCFLQAFLRNVCLRPACHKCRFKTLNRQSDITLGDFWGIEKLIPEMHDNKGISLVFANTNRGRKILEDLDVALLLRVVNIHQALKYNPPATKSVPPNPKRDLFFRDLERLNFEKLVKKYASDSIFVTLKRFSKRVLSKTKKIITRRAGKI